MIIAVCGTQSNPTTSFKNDTSIASSEVYYITSKDDYNGVDAMVLDLKEWTMTGWINPPKIHIPKYNVIIKRRNIIRNALPRKVRECHS
mgnify:CR=1 FL=1